MEELVSGIKSSLCWALVAKFSQERRRRRCGGRGGRRGRRRSLGFCLRKRAFPFPVERKVYWQKFSGTIAHAHTQPPQRQKQRRELTPRVGDVSDQGTTEPLGKGERDESLLGFEKQTNKQADIPTTCYRHQPNLHANTLPGVLSNTYNIKTTPASQCGFTAYCFCSGCNRAKLEAKQQKRSWEKRRLTCENVNVAAFPRWNTERLRSHVTGSC